MKIVLYNTNSNNFEGKKISTKTLPSCKSQFDKLCTLYPDCEFVVVAQRPGTFLLDLEVESIKEKSEKVKYILIEENNSPNEIAEVILNENPNLAIATTFWVEPFDWLCVKDALIAEILQKNGIRTISHSKEIGIECFDKFRTHLLLEKLGLNVAKAVYVHHWLFICAGTKACVKENIYAECVLEQIKNLNYPVIIKDTVGLSSYGMQVVEDFEKAKQFLYSRRNNSDRIVEELIHGEQFGTEIHGTKGNYEVLPPLMFSVNKYGITSPKQSIKIGPVTNEKYKIKELQESLLKMANELEFSGIAQVDLVFSNGKWYIIEINPRLSGMTSTYAVSKQKSILEVLIEIALEKNKNQNLEKVMNFKIPLVSQERMQELKKIESVKYISQIENYAATQKREVGYAEIIISSEDLMSELEKIKMAFPELIEEIFYENAKNIISKT